MTQPLGHRLRSPRSLGWIVILGVAVLAAVVFVVPGRQLGLNWLLAYLCFAALTVFVLRKVAIEPGAWLSRRTVRRTIVALIVLACMALVAVPGSVLGGAILLVLLFIALCDIILGRATDRIAMSPAVGKLDERQHALRDRAHRIAYWLLAGLIAGVVIPAYLVSSGSRAWLMSIMTDGGFLALLALIACLPAMVVAWVEPDRLPPEDTVRGVSWQGSLASAMVVISLVTPLASATGVLFLPIHRPPLVRTAIGTAAAKCALFTDSERVGVWFSAELPLSAEICWNGTTAQESWGLNETDCHLAGGNFVTIRTESCTRRTDPDGTLRFTYAVIVHPALLPFLGRKMEIGVAVGRDGRAVLGQ
jgi:hypothetical protein